MKAQSDYLNLQKRSEAEVRQHMHRTVTVPLRAEGEPNAGGCLYRMSNGNLALLSEQEVLVINCRSVAAGEGGGCIPARCWPRVSTEPASAERCPSNIPHIIAGVLTFGAMAALWTAEWWLGPVTRFLDSL